MAKPTSRAGKVRSSARADTADQSGLMATVKKVAKFLSRPAPAGATAKPAKGASKAKAAVTKAAKTVTKKVTAKAPAAKKKAPAAKAKTPAAKAPAAKAPAAKAAAAKAPVAKAAAAKKAPAAKAGPTKAVARTAAAPEKKVAAKKKATEKKQVEQVSQAIEVPAPRPRASKLPPLEEPLTKRSMEGILTAGAGRGVSGEGSLKGKLIVKEGFPYLHVVGRDKRELVFLLQGPDQEVLPAYADHKVSVSGLVRKTTNYGGTVDVRKWAAKKPESEVAAPAETEQKLRFLSPGEIEQLITGGMGAGLIGFARLRGNLEMTGEEFFLVVSGAGTRQQVSFILSGKNTKGLRKHVGQTLEVTGVAEKSSGWGGKIELETFELRPPEVRITSRDSMPMAHVENLGDEPTHVDVALNGGLTVRLPERPGFTWAIEPTSAKRIGLREANFEPSANGQATREFFFTPRNPGTFEVDFFLAKAFNPGQVASTCRLVVNVKQQA